MSDLFAAIAQSEDERSNKLGASRAKIAAVARVEQKFAKYVTKEAGAEEDKIDFLKQDILATVTAACAEHGMTAKEDIQTALDAAMASLRAASGSCRICGGELSEGESGSCEQCDWNKKKDQFAVDELGRKDQGDQEGDHPEVRPKKESSAKVADGPPTGDTYTQETVKLPTSTADGSPTGLGGPVPETDAGKVPAKGLAPIDVPSKAHPSEMQSVRPKDHDEKLTEFDPAHSPVHDQVDVSKPIGEEQVGARTDTFGTPEGQASAVTSSKWRVESE